MDRALRRFYADRWKKRVAERLKQWRWSGYPTPRRIGIGRKTRKVCGHFCCKNRRAYEGVTLQERRDYMDYLSQLADL